MKTTIRLATAAGLNPRRRRRLHRSGSRPTCPPGNAGRGEPRRSKPWQLVHHGPTTNGISSQGRDRCTLTEQSTKLRDHNSMLAHSIAPCRAKFRIPMSTPVDSGSPKSLGLRRIASFLDESGHRIANCPLATYKSTHPLEAATVDMLRHQLPVLCRKCFPKGASRDPERSRNCTRRTSSPLRQRPSQLPSDAIQAIWARAFAARSAAHRFQFCPRRVG